MDAYLKTQLRLAERQGLLQQKHLSAVQAFGLFILNHLDAIDRAQADVRDVKYSLIATGEWDYKTLFPEYATKEEARDLEEGEELPTNAVWDTTEVDWRSPTENPGEFEKIMASLNQAPGTFSGNDLVDDQVTWSEWE